jgi:hypothetical protein
VAERVNVRGAVVVEHQSGGLEREVALEIYFGLVVVRVLELHCLSCPGYTIMVS